MRSLGGNDDGRGAHRPPVHKNARPGNEADKLPHGAKVVLTARPCCSNDGAMRYRLLKAIQSGL